MGKTGESEDLEVTNKKVWDAGIHMCTKSRLNIHSYTPSTERQGLYYRKISIVLPKVRVGTTTFHEINNKK